MWYLSLKTIRQLDQPHPPLFLGLRILERLLDVRHLLISMRSSLYIAAHYTFRLTLDQTCSPGVSLCYSGQSLREIKNHSSLLFTNLLTSLTQKWGLQYGAAFDDKSIRISHLMYLSGLPTQKHFLYLHVIGSKISICSPKWGPI